eukprot:3639056-Amphidinium_carterae.1
MAASVGHGGDGLPSKDPTAARRVLQDVRLLRSLRHENILDSHQLFSSTTAVQRSALTSYKYDDMTACALHWFPSALLWLWL